MGDWTDKATTVAVHEGNIYVGGKQMEYVASGNHNVFWWIKEFDNSDGSEDTTNWDKTIEKSDWSSESMYDMVIYDDVSDWQNDRVIFCSQNNPTADFVVHAYDTFGNFEWKKSFDAEGYIDTAYAMALYGCMVYVVGKGSSDTFVSYWWIKQFRCTDGDENTYHWDKKIVRDGAYDRAYSVAVGNDNTIYIGGVECSDISLTDDNCYFKKFHPDGTEIDLTGGNLYTSAENADDHTLMPYTINGLDVAFGTESYDDEIIDILVNSSTDIVYLVADVHNGNGFSIRTLHDE
jgi:hypothetical protein